MAAKTQAVTSWDKALADAAAKAAHKEAASASTGQFFSIRGGQLTFGGVPVPGNQMGCVILASTIERVYYEGMYDPQSPTSPACYAFGDDPANMVPHDQAENKQHSSCDGCSKNEWGTSNRGKGKACREMRRLYLLSAGTYDRDGKFQLFGAEELKNATTGLLRVPTTSIKAYSSWVVQLAGAAQRPPWSVVCRIKVMPDAANQVAVTFTTEENLTPALGAVVQGKMDAAERSLVFPYAKITAAAKPAPARGGARKF